MKNLMNKIRKSNKGFTLVELIIVIAIIAVLTAVLAPQYIKYVDQSRWAADQNACNTLMNEVQVAAVEVGMNGKNATNPATDDGSIVITKAASGATTFTTDKLSTELTAALVAADANWNKIKITNNGTAAKKEDASAKYTTYTITVKADGSVTGEWTA